MTAPDPQTYDVVDAEAADVETLFEIYLDVGADPAGGEAIRDVSVEGWIRRRRVYAARRDGVTVGGFLRSNFRPWPGTLPRPATWSPGPNEAAAWAPPAHPLPHGAGLLPTLTSTTVPRHVWQDGGPRS